MLTLKTYLEEVNYIISVNSEGTDTKETEWGRIHTDFGISGKKVNIALLDNEALNGSIRTKHPVIRKKFIKKEHPEDDVPSMPKVAHATIIAALISADKMGMDDGTSFTGVAPDARIYNYIIAGKKKRTNIANITLALEKILEYNIENESDKKIHIILMPFTERPSINSDNKFLMPVSGAQGYYGFEEEFKDYRRMLAILKELTYLNVIIVAAAGNYFLDIGKNDGFTPPACFSTCFCIGAASFNAIDGKDFHLTPTTQRLKNGPTTMTGFPYFIVAKSVREDFLLEKFDESIKAGIEFPSSTSTSSAIFAGLIALMLEKLNGVTSEPGELFKKIQGLLNYKIIDGHFKFINMFETIKNMKKL